MVNQLVKRCRPLPAEATLLVLGAGFSGSRIASLAKALGTRVITTNRLADANDPEGSISFDSQLGRLASPDRLRSVTHLVSTIAPERDGQDPVLRCLGNQLRNMPLQWVGYLSTTGVYGDRQGQWVSETDPAVPTQERSKRRLACEQAWLRQALPVQILRLPGIYGPGRSPFQAIKRGEIRPIHKPGHRFSRVHVDDIAGACMHLIDCAASGRRPPIVNVCDDLPVEPAQVQHYAAELLGVSLPQNRPFADASTTMSPMARSFWAEHRRVSNQLLCQELGYQLLHPDFRSGLRDCWEQEQHKSQ
ncbi:MAG: SDR family oxidoreductase [Synechococcus sp.]